MLAFAICGPNNMSSFHEGKLRLLLLLLLLRFRVAIKSNGQSKELYFKHYLNIGLVDNTRPKLTVNRVTCKLFFSLYYHVVMLDSRCRDVRVQGHFTSHLNTVRGKSNSSTKVQ